MECLSHVSVKFAVISFGLKRSLKNGLLVIPRSEDKFGIGGCVVICGPGRTCPFIAKPGQ